MPVMQVRNAEAQMLGSTDHLRTDDRNFAAEWYDNVGISTPFITYTQVPLGAIRHNAAPEVFVMASNILTITEAGLYLFHYTILGDSPGSTSESHLSGKLMEDPDTGVFADVFASQAIATMFSSAATVSNLVVLRVGANYRYQVMANSFGTNTTIVTSSSFGASKLSVIRLFKNG